MTIAASIHCPTALNFSHIFHYFLSAAISMSNAFLMLGNIRTLVLSWNQLSTVAGLERMYSLERLAIDHNNIQFLQDAAGLANLPELMHLEIKGNPIETNGEFDIVSHLNLSLYFLRIFITCMDLKHRPSRSSIL